MKKLIFQLLIVAIVLSCSEKDQIIYLDETDLSKMEIGWGENQANQSVEGNPITIAGEHFERGVGTHAISKMMIALHGTAEKFEAYAGVDDESGDRASVEFFVMGDKMILWQSGIMKKGDKAKKISIPLEDIQKLGLYISNGGDNINYDHADWADAKIHYKGEKPLALSPPVQKTYTLTPPTPPEPRINYPWVTGASPGKPFLFRIPVTGEKPVHISVEHLPAGLKFDQEKRIIHGTTPPKGEYVVNVTAENKFGKDVKRITIKSGHGLALTPPMGWNSWNCWGLSVDQEKVKAAADALVSSGLADHGWTYINIDDGWEAEQRTENRELLANEKFPDMKALADHIHDYGLKLGIYSSPGPYTCGGYLGSHEHEKQDAETWADWGIDYLKYDWCSYNDIAADRSLPELKKPYIFMDKILKDVDRDIVYSLCQYGMGDVWTWGEEVGGNLWRTTGDITDTWSSMSRIGFSQDKCSPYAGPGHWNDPDMLVVGQLGWGPDLHKTRLTPDEQYTHISLWSLLSAPLLLGCDLTQLDDFTLNLLTNDEVIAVNQAPLGDQAIKVKDENGKQVWAKKLVDGTLAVGLFYTGTDDPVEAMWWEDEMPASNVKISWEELGIEGSHKIRDLWRQKTIPGNFTEGLEAQVPYHGVILVRLLPME
ncbi:MAG: NPCBM/NEW2 domain-containing protein [Bacteroidales bacterium]|nr:NPCBM/NEW2 domain-containing protein [Bacteroidales bacterium]MCF8399631.1 NPCBM/NEW2 domain-containing protein [Bacteroidales bacterium]